jgi:chemotaxis protein MotA
MEILGGYMELTTLFGIIVGFIAVIGAMIFKKISFSVFINPAAFFVIFVGTIASVLNSFPGENLKSIGALFRILFTKSNGMNEAEIIELMVNYSNDARKEGLLSLESKVESIEDPFIRKGIRMVIDGIPDDAISDILGTEIAAMEERHAVNASIFSSAGMYAPTLGVLGAVFGLIAAMSHIDNVEAMSEAISAAFIATVLGIFTGYVLWNPFAKKLKVKSHEEAVRKGMIVEGILSIQKGDSPLMIKEKLLAVLPQSKQEEVLQEMKLD